MRDYLYIWHNKESQFIVASGIEFRDLSSQTLKNRGIVLLKHDSENSEFDESSWFEFVPQERVSKLAKENIYSWGDFCWADYSSETFPEIPKKEIAELLYFSHKSEPLDQIRISSLQNKYLFDAHDDGWFLKMYYENWKDMEGLIDSLELPFDRKKLIKVLNTTKDAYWISGGAIETEEATLDINEILNKRLR